MIPRGCSRWGIVRLFFFFLTIPVTAVAQTAQPWPQADKLFRADPSWLGGDAAFSVDLGKGRVLWMFGDSFIAGKSGDTRAQSTFIRNSVAIETGYDPSKAAIKFYEGHRDGRVSDFAAAGDPTTWLWPLHGVRLGKQLILFFMRIAPDPRKDSLGFQVVGWTAFLTDNPDADPSDWKLRELDGPEEHGNMLIGMSIARDTNNVDAFVLDSVTHDAYLLRWPAGRVARGELSTPEWWCGPSGGWLSNSRRRQIVIPGAGAEFSVQREPGGGYVEVNSAGFGATTIVARHAEKPEGPWSAPHDIYRPPESNAPGALVYGAKSHPELVGSDLVVTYAANGNNNRLMSDMTIYFPRFVKVALPIRAPE